MKRIGIIGVAIVIVLAFGGGTASPVLANPPLACYKAKVDEFGVTGNYKNATCTEKTAILKGAYVLAEPLLFLKEDLWCAKITPVVGPPGTGLYENATCTKTLENGEFTEIIEPPLPPLACYKAEMDEFGVTGNYKNATCTEKTAVLKGEYVLAEPLLFIKGDLWCAKMAPVVGPPGTGQYENATCTKKKEDGEFTEVIVPGATPNILPEASTEANLTDTTSSGKSSFGNGILEISSTKSSGMLTGNELKSGLFETTFEGAMTVLTKEKCVGLGGATTGNVLVSGTYHVRARSTTSTAIIFLLKPVHFWCPPSTLVLVTGCVAGALSPENLLTKALTVTLAKNGTKNDNLIITVLNEANTSTELCELLSSVNGGSIELSSEVTTQTLAGFKQNGTAIEVLVMPL